MRVLEEHPIVSRLFLSVPIETASVTQVLEAVKVMIVPAERETIGLGRREMVDRFVHPVVVLQPEHQVSILDTKYLPVFF